MPGGGILLQQVVQTFISNGSLVLPNQLAALPGVYCWGPAGNAANGTQGANGGGGGGGGGFGGEPALGAVHAGTTLTATVTAAGSVTATTVTGGSVTVSANGGGNASGTSGGSAAGAGTNTLARAGGAGGNGSALDGGGGGGASGGSTGAGGNGATGSGGGTGGAAGTGAAGPPSLAGASGGNGATGSVAAQNGNTPGAAGGGGSSTAGLTAAGTSQGGQAVIAYQLLTIIPAPVPRRRPSRAFIAGPPLPSNFPSPVQVPAPPQQPASVPPRRRPSRAVVLFVPVTTTNAPPPPPPVVLPWFPSTGGTVNFTIREFREIRPGDIPASGAQLPRLTGRAYEVPIPNDVEHTPHAWPEEIPPVPPVSGMLDALGQAAASAYAASSKAVELGRIFADPPYERQPKKCGAIRKVGGVMLTCGRKPGHHGKHSDRGLDWR